MTVGLFAPGWKKTPEKALKRIKESKVPEELYRIVTETDFPGADGVRVKAEAVERLGSFHNPEGRAALERLAREGATPLLRCQAAYLLDNDEGRKILTDRLAEAYADRGVFLTRRSEDWISAVHDAAIYRAAFEAAPEDFRQRLAWKLSDPELQLVYILKAGNERLAKKLMDAFRGRAEDYTRIALESPYSACRDAAVSRLGMEQEDVLRKLADGGSWTAQQRLLNLNLVKYAARYPDRMTGKMMIKAIEQNAYSPEKLENMAMRSDVSRGSVAWAAMEALDDPERLERVLLEHETSPRARQPGGPWETWILRLLERLRDREEAMVRYVLSSRDGHIAALETAALQNVHSPEALLRVAMQDVPAALDAAKRLEGADLETLAGSESRQVAEWASGRKMSQLIGNSGEEDALEIMRWTLTHDKDRDRYEKALRQVLSQQGLMTALLDLLKNIKAFDGTEELENGILGRITDGPSFTDWCLENVRPADRACVERLRALIAGTPEQERLTQACAEAIVRGVPDLAPEAWLLSVYFDVSSPEAVWQTCGKRFLWRLIEFVEQDTEKEHVLTAADRMKWLYRHTPEARPALERYNGRMLKKHNDYHDEYCAGNSRNRNETFTIFIK